MNDGAKIRILIAEDHRLVREGIRAMLEPECDVVAEAGSGEEAIALALKTRPDVLLLDIEMPGIGGLAAAHRLKRQLPATKVLVLSQYEDEEYVFETLADAGVAGYVVKTDSPSELKAAVRAVHGGKRYLSPSIAPLVLDRIGRAGGGPSGGARETSLTRREREVLRLIALGATAKEIAAKLGISPRTAQVHRENLKFKLKVSSTAAMVRWAIRHKLVRAG